MAANIQELKKTVFFSLLELAGRVFIVVRYSENVLIGTRGFTDEERKNGIVLVLNTKMNFTWDDGGLATTLVFGATPQKCYVPAEDIIVVYSPELHIQFICAPATPGGQEANPAESRKAAAEGAPEKTDSKIVHIDFHRKRTRPPRKH